MKDPKTLHFSGFQRGIGQSEWDQSRFHRLINVDVHSKPGVVSCSKATERADASIVDDLATCKAIVPSGDTFFGTNSGDIFKVTPTGVTTLVHTSSQGAVYGMDYLDGYFYYASATKLGRISLALASSEATWASQNDTWATFSVGTIYKAFKKQSLSLFITDGYYVASVDNTGAFSPNVLDFETNQIGTALYKWKTYLVIGTSQGSAADKAGVFVWDCFSPSWSDDDEISERGVNCFIDGDNVFYASIGLIGNIYYWNGSEMVFMEQLKDGDNLVTTGVCPYNSANLNGMPLFATNRGVFSFGRSFPIVPVIEYVNTAGQGITAGALAAVGNQVFSAFKNGSAYGIDKLSENLATGIVVLPVALGKVSELKARYARLPTGTSLTLRISKDTADFSDKPVTKDDKDERCYKSKTNVENKAMMQAEWSLVPNGSESPEVYDFEVL